MDELEPDEHDQEEADYQDAPPPISVDPNAMQFSLDFAQVRKAYNSDGTLKTYIKARKSAFVSKLLYLNGSPFSFEGRNYLIPIYDGNDNNILLKTSRQVEKTTFLGNQLTVDSAVVPYNKALYVSPSHSQTRQFSNEKLRPSIEQSPMIKKYLQSSSISTQVFEKGFTNGSYVFLRSAFRSADRTRGISARNICYDKSSYILTKNGWVKACNLSKKDYVADVNDLGVVEWNRPTRIIKYDHNGDMVRFTHGGIDLRVTGDHNMWVNFKVKDRPNTRKEDKFVFKKAIDLYHDNSEGFKFTSKAAFTFKPLETITIEGVELPYKAFCGFLGWYLADGCISCGYPRLSISEAKLVKVKPILDAMGVHYRVYLAKHRAKIRTVEISSKALGVYFKKLGKSHTKFIPREVFTGGGIELVLKGLYQGDACYHEGEKWENGTLRTRSRALAESVQEAWIMLGRPAVIHTRMHPNKALNLTPDASYELVPLYEICSYNIDYSIFWGAQKEKRIHLEAVTNEEVYCFTVKNHRPIVKGDFKSKPIISGNCLDEIQDFIGSEIPVILECSSHFPDARVLMAGTPKSFDNPIEAYWQESTQNEWLVPCYHHTPVYWNFLDETNVGPTEFYLSGKIPPGPICKKCLRPINPAIGQWMTFAPDKRIKGYRIAQIMVPWIISTHDQWLKLLWKRDNYPLGQFYNEVLGLSYDNASKPITRDELIACCDPTYQMLPDHPTAEQAQWGRGRLLIGGVDWGEGNDGTEKSPNGKPRHASYSVFTMGHYVDQKRFKVMYVKKYTGQQADPDFVVRDIARLCGVYDVKLVGVDWGHGWGVNNQLVRMLGPSRVIQFQYLPKLKNKLKWDPVGFRYHLQRNLLISELFLMLKEQRVVFPAWKVIEPYAKDILAVFVEYVEYRREMKYDHKTSDPDDFLHSLHYAIITANIHLGKYPRV